MSDICGSVNRKLGMTSWEVRRKTLIAIIVVDGIAAIAWKLGIKAASGSNLPGLCSTASGIAILPTSCS